MKFVPNPLQGPATYMDDFEGFMYLPVFKCPACKEEFLGNYSKPDRKDLSDQTKFFSCDQCANVLMTDFSDDQNLFLRHVLDFKKYGSRVFKIIAENLKPCPCGGKFSLSYESRCPECGTEISDCLLDYPLIRELGKKAFNREEDYEDYLKTVNAKSRGKIGLEFGAWVEVASEFREQGRLAEVPKQQLLRIKRGYLPVHAGKILIGQRDTMIENAKRNLFELYTASLYRKGTDNAALRMSYQAAWCIAWLAGAFFELQDVSIGKMVERFGEVLREGNVDERIKRLAKEKSAKAFTEWRRMNKGRFEKSWKFEVAKQVEKWRSWWQINKDRLQV